MRLPLGVLCLLALPRAAAAADPFAPYLDSVPPVVESLTSENSGAGAGAITTRTFTFASRGGKNVIYAIHSAPQAAGKYPGLLVLHGGGGNAETVAGIAKAMAGRGYVTLAVDLPHLCQPNCSAKTTGPWRMRPLGEAPRFEVEPGPEQSVLMDAELAGVEGFNWLRAQPNVDAASMGIFGYSWGGYSTTFLSGLLGAKVKAAYAVFGCGFYDKGSFWKQTVAQLSSADRELWLATFDAGRRAPNIKAAYFLEGESNDTYFWPEAVQATVDAVPGTVNHVWGPNLNHHQVATGTQMIQLHLDYYLKGQGAPFAKAQVGRIETLADQSKRVRIDVEVPSTVTIASTQLYYSPRAANWQDRTWSAINATSTPDGHYDAVLSPDLASQLLDFYGLVTDSRGVVTSTSMYDSTSVVAPASGGGGMGGAPGGGAGGVASAGAPAMPSGGAGTGGNLSGAGGLLAAGGGAGGLASGEKGGSGAGSPGAVADSSDGCSCRMADERRPVELWSLSLVAGLALVLVARRRGRA